MRRFAALLAGLLCMPQIGLAAAQQVSASSWTVYGNDVVLSYTFPKALAAQLVLPDTRSSSTEAIARYVFSRASVRRKGEACAAVDQGYDLGSIDARYVGPAVLSFEIFFRCAGDSGTLVLGNDAFFDQSPGQIGIANVWVAGMPVVSRLITPGHTAISIDTAQSSGSSGPAAYIGLGLRHAFTSLVGLCTAFGLLLLLRGRRELLPLIGGLGGGYLIASAASAAGGWSLQAESARAFGGFLVLLIGALLAARGSGRPNAVQPGFVVVTGVAATLVALLGHGAAALCLAGAGIFGVLLLPFAQGEHARWTLLTLGVLAGTLDGFWLASMFAPLHAVVLVGAAHVFACSVGALLGVLVIFAVVAAARMSLRRFAGFLRAPIYRDVVTACLATVGVFSMVAT